MKDKLNKNLVKLYRKNAKAILNEYPVITVLFVLSVILMVVGSFNEGFLTEYNRSNLVKTLSFLGITALGQTVVLASGGIDLSVNAIYLFAGAFCAVATQFWGMPLLGAVILGVLLSTLIGITTGLIVIYSKVSPFIVTLSVLGVVSACTKFISEKYQVMYLPMELRARMDGNLWGLPISLFVFLMLAIFIAVLLQSTVLGRWIFAIGSNEESVRKAGVRTRFIKIMVYGLSGTMAGVAGLLDASRIGFVSPSFEYGYELVTIAAAIIGSLGFSSGVTAVLGTTVGAAFISITKNIMFIANIMSDFQAIIMTGVLLVMIVIGSRKIIGDHVLKG